MLPTDQLLAQMKSSLDRRNPFVCKRVRMAGGDGIWWTSTQPCYAWQVREVVHLTTRNGRNILVNTGGHGDASGADPTKPGYGEYQFTAEDFRTIEAAPLPGKCSLHTVSAYAKAVYPAERIDIIDAWCYSEGAKEMASGFLEASIFF